MADEGQYHHHHHEKKAEEPCEVAVPKVEECSSVEASDRGLFDFAKKEEEKCGDEEVIVTEFEHKAQVCPPKVDEYAEKEKKHEGFVEKLHRSGSSSSSSSEEEVEEGGVLVKRKKKKGLKEKIKEKVSGEHKEEVKCEDTSVPVEKCDDAVPEPEEKKGFLVKIKEKLPGSKKPEEVPAEPPSPDCSGEKKGFLDKIKEKIPGYGHSKAEEVKEAEKEKESACH